MKNKRHPLLLYVDRLLEPQPRKLSKRERRALRRMELENIYREGFLIGASAVLSNIRPKQ